MIAPRSQLDRQRAVSTPYRRILLPPIENTAYPTDMSAQRVGTNRSYLSQYFSRQGITYNTYINNLRIKHFISCYEESIAAGQTVSAQQLAYESGFRSYRTFSRAFMQRTGQSVTTWKCDTGGYLAKRNNFLIDLADYYKNIWPNEWFLLSLRLKINNIGYDRTQNRI